MSSKELNELKIKSTSNKNVLKSFENEEKFTIKNCDKNVIIKKGNVLKLKNEKKKLKGNDSLDNVCVNEIKEKTVSNNNNSNVGVLNSVRRRVGRPLSETYGRKVTVHKTNNYRYLSLQHKKVVNGKELYCHFHLGRLDDNDEFIPSINYILSSTEFRDNLIFPDFVKMNIVDNMKEGWYSNAFATHKIANTVKSNVIANNGNVILPVKKKVAIQEKIRKEETEKIIEFEKNKSKNKVLEKEKELEFVK